MAQEQLKIRTGKYTAYRGIRKYDATYSGFLFCGDCNLPMFSRSRQDMLKDLNDDIYGFV